MWCKLRKTGIEDNVIGSRVLVWGWGGTDDNRTVKCVAVVVGGGMTMVHGEEQDQRINDARYAYPTYLRKGFNLMR